MSNIAALDVKKLREATGAGMMAAKKALEEVGGDFDKAVEVLRIKGETKAAERSASRTAANGIVATSGTALVELNCETDFVAKNEQFQQLATDIVAAADAAKATDTSSVLAAKLSDGRTVEESIGAVAAVIGEKLALGRVAVFEGTVATYMHRRSSDLPPQVGVMVEYSGGNAEAARATAMQIAAMKPTYVRREEVPADVVENERRIAEATAREEGKPEPAIAKITEGRLNGFFKETVLLEQPSVQENKKTVGAVLSEAGVDVTRFARFEVGS